VLVIIYIFFMKKSGSGSKTPTYFELVGMVKASIMRLDHLEQDVKEIYKVMKLNNNTTTRLLDRIKQLEHGVKINAGTVGRIIDRVLNLKATARGQDARLDEIDEKLKTRWIERVMYFVYGLVLMGIVALLFQINFF
jgi:hypothetical protein